MNYLLRLLFGISAVLMFGGCDSDRVAGFYYSRSGDALWIKPNGEVHYSPLSKTREDFRHLCMLNYKKETNQASFIFHSASPYIGTTIRFSEDLQTIYIEWQRLDGKTVEYQSNEFRRVKK